MNRNKTLKFVCILLAIAVIVSGCVSSTLLQTNPSNASVYVQGQRLGNTPYTYSDRKIAGTSTLITFKKDGYEDYNTTLRKVERMNYLALAGVFFVYPLFWVMSYDKEHSYYLVEIVEDEVPEEILTSKEIAEAGVSTEDEQLEAGAGTRLVSDYDLDLPEEPVQNQRVKNLLEKDEVEKALSFAEKQTGSIKTSCDFTIADYYLNKGDLSLASEYFELSGNGKTGYLKTAEYLTKGENIDSIIVIDESKIKEYLGKVYDDEIKIVAHMAYLFNENVNSIKKRLALSESMKEMGVSSMSSNGKMIDISTVYATTKMQNEVYSSAAKRMHEQLEKLNKIEELKKEFAELDKESSATVVENNNDINEEDKVEPDEKVSKPVPRENTSNSLFPEGEELITLLSATLSPEVITTAGATISVKFKNNESVSVDNLIPVVVFVTNSMTITTRTFARNIFSSDNVVFSVSNPSSTPSAYSFYDPNAGQLSGSGTIYCYLEDPGDANDKNDSKRVSNVLSIYATFK